jgi:hypothetical protein
MQLLLEHLNVALDGRRRLALGHRFASRPICAKRHYKQGGRLVGFDRFDDEVDKPPFNPQILLFDPLAGRKGALHRVAHLCPQAPREIREQI